MLKKVCFLFIVFVSCVAQKHSKEEIVKYKTPPGVVKLSHNIYLDKTEITNFSYLEFMYWTARVYKSRKEYNKILPDTGQWIMLGKGYDSLAVNYLRHPIYRDYPVVGISFEQAKLFSTWRSDRVMEFILIREGIIKHKPFPHKDSVFTIEKYFAGNYYGIKPHSDYFYYPEYSLPDSLTYVKAIDFADSLNALNSKKCKTKRCEDIFTLNCLENIKNKSEKLPYGPNPLLLSYCKSCRKQVITHLKGNAAELTSTQNIIFGGSYRDSCQKMTSTNFYKEEVGKCNVGFRNVCKWKKWGD